MRARSSNGSGQSVSIDSAASSSRSAASMSPIRSSATARSQRNATRAARGTFGSSTSANMPSAAAPARPVPTVSASSSSASSGSASSAPSSPHQIDEPVDLGPRRALGGCGKCILQRLVRVGGVDQQQRHLVVHIDQRVQRERVVGVEVISLGQRCAPALETPTGEIEPAGCEPLAADVRDRSRRRSRTGAAAAR